MKPGKQPANNTIVYIVDDDDGLRNSLNMLIQKSGYNAHICASATEFLEAYEPNTVGCLLLDVRMPGINGLELQQKLAAENYDIPIIIMTGHADVSMAVQAMKNGAIDFIEKPFHNQELLTILQQCMTEARKKQLKRHKNLQTSKTMSQLTPRERQIMDLIVDGLPNKKIANLLAISVRTVEAHRAHIMEKLNVKTLPDLVRLKLIDKGISETED